MMFEEPWAANEGVEAVAQAPVRTHIVVPRELVEEVDRLAGPRKRSEFIAAAVQEKLARERRERAFEESAGILDPANYPEWNTGEDISAWVRGLRVVDNTSFE